jgi:hypothetical protein
LKDIPENLVFDAGSNPYDMPFAEWTGKWWKWIRSFPSDTSPASDTTGEFCSISQPYPNVWFLAGTYGDSVTRTCTIPFGKALFFPIISSYFSFAGDPHLKSEDELLEAAKKDIDTVKQLEIVVDDATFGQLDQFRVGGGPFDDVFEGVETKFASDGFWIFLKPPKIGNHTIHFVGENIDFFNEVTYHISTISDQ